MEKNITDQIMPTLKYLPAALAASYFKKSSNVAVTACKAKTGGFVKGVCHPNGNYEQLKGAGLGWIRVDIPYPFDANGEICESYTAFRNKIAGYVQNGIKVMAVTPYPKQFIEAGIDPRNGENDGKVAAVARFIVKDLKGLVGIFQITNEMGVPHFTLPLTMDEAAHFIGIQAKAMYFHRGNSLIGYNSAGPQVDLHTKMRPYFDYIDYVGIDIYLGCFADITCYMYMFDALLRYLWSFTGKPVILAEFGYISGGAPKTPAERTAVLQRYGASSEDEARESIEAFVSHMPERIQNHLALVSPDKSHWADYLFKSDFRNHFYCELPAKTLIPGYPHTPEGQADFYRDVFRRLKKLNFLCGAFIYCYSDSRECYICSQQDCPTETRWGIVDVDGNEKPSYFAVRDALSNL